MTELEEANTQAVVKLVCIRADVLSLLDLIGVEPAGIMTFEADLLLVRRYILGLQDAVAQLRAQRNGAIEQCRETAQILEANEEETSLSAADRVMVELRTYRTRKP